VCFDSVSGSLTASATRNVGSDTTLAMRRFSTLMVGEAQPGVLLSTTENQRQ
jgi:hypothetical protein